jgi:tetratricopeptide (TPR) repeat protein
MALEAARQDGHGLLEAKALNNIGLLEKEEGNPDRARTRYDRALAINQREDNAAGMADNLNNLGTLSLNASDYDAAIEYYERALAIDKAREVPEAIALDLFNIATAYSLKEDYTTALNYYGRALMIFDLLTDRARVAETFFGMGHASEESGDVPRARESYTSSADVAESAGMSGLAEKARLRAAELSGRADSFSSP